MVARLGNVLFWLGIIIAVGWLALSYSVISSSGLSVRDPAIFLTVFGLPAVIAAIGWTFRYILSGS